MQKSSLLGVNTYKRYDKLQWGTEKTHKSKEANQSKKYSVNSERRDC